MNAFELGWLVGILEGEGYFGYQDRGQRIKVGMIDFDTIERCVGLIAKIIGHVPRIHSTMNKSGSEHFFVQIGGENARKVMRAVVPYMGYRRRRKIWQCLNKYRAPKGLPITHIVLAYSKKGDAA